MAFVMLFLAAPQLAPDSASLPFGFTKNVLHRLTFGVRKSNDAKAAHARAKFPKEMMFFYIIENGTSQWVLLLLPY
jgi:hypothetical protein